MSAASTSSMLGKTNAAIAIPAAMVSGSPIPSSRTGSPSSARSFLRSIRAASVKSAIAQGHLGEYLDELGLDLVSDQAKHERAEHDARDGEDDRRRDGGGREPRRERSVAEK